jgi:sugar lactone lactonase YvrE
MFVAAQSGMIWTLAGTGEPGFSGDGGQAVSACLCEPKNIALDGAGNLYIADSENHVIRKVDLNTRLITTIAGHSGRSSSDAGSFEEPSTVDPSEEDLFGGPSQKAPERFAQLTDVSGTVRFVIGKALSARFHGDGDPAIHAELNFPSAVAVDHQGHLYIADTMNHRVRMVDVRSGMISTIAGTGQHRFSGDGGPAVSAALNEPVALAVDRKGRLYIADQSNNRVRMVSLETGVITTAAGTGESAYSGDGMPATESALAGPSGLALDSEDALYIADTFSGRVRRVDPVTGIISTVAGDGGNYRYQGEAHDFSTSLSRPNGIALDGEGNILITDSDNHLIRRWNHRKKIVTRVAGNGFPQFGGDGGPPLDSSLNFPFGVAVDRRGNIYIADTFNHRIRVIAA